MTRKRRAVRKPSGIAGGFRVARTERGFAANQIKIEWPTEQKQIERKILGYFMREFERAGATFLRVEDGGTENLDFLLTLPKGKAYLELMEAVIPEDGQKPHQPGAQWHRPVPYADKVFLGVQKKIDDYGFNHSTPVDLLIYITHEQYAPNPAAIQVLRSYFADRPHPFYYVFFIVPLAEDTTPIHLLFNRDHPLKLMPLDALAECAWVSLPCARLDVHKGPVSG
jgi:hypothetical protein